MVKNKKRREELRIQVQNNNRHRDFKTKLLQSDEPLRIVKGLFGMIFDLSKSDILIFIKMKPV